MRGFWLDVRGDFACFTRPEMKVERVSYDVITPSAARAIYESILWKPAMVWRIRLIEILKPILWISVRRNEIGALATGTPIDINAPKKRQQRGSLLLRDVRYRLHAEFERRSPAAHLSRNPNLIGVREDAEENELMRQPESDAKYAAMFERRARKGQCVNQPYLGCREFSADVRFIPPEMLEAERIAHPPLADLNRPLDWMLYDLDFQPSPALPIPMFYRPEVCGGVITVPPPNSDLVRR